MSEAGPSVESHDDLPTQAEPSTRTRTALPGALDDDSEREIQEQDKYFKPAVIALVSIIVVSLLLALYWVITG